MGRKKGFLFSLGAIFIVLIMLLYFQNFLDKEDYDSELAVQENKFLMYNDFSEDVYKKYFSNQLRIVTINALINETKWIEFEPTYVVRNLSNDTKTAILTGYVRSHQILKENTSLPHRMNQTHSILPQGYNFEFNLTRYNLNQTDWNQFSVFYQVKYSLISPEITFERTFNQTLFMSVNNLYLFGDRIGPSWDEDATSDAECIFKHYNDTYDCQGVNGINNTGP